MQINTSQNQQVHAVLGPTNTGKTYLALERMMAHSTGMIGFPLRLLARENYDRVVEKKGKDQVALITGEEKILPPYARYFLCTVESMPLDREVDFLAVDEIQLCSDPDRGHIFTDRLLNARGRHETMFMGSLAIAPLIKALVDNVSFEDRPRFSKLTYSGSKKITRLPNRCAIVAFSASEVYAIAELIRRQKGGAAVVLGALSPRTRNAQVDLYQEGEVDYIVATDAIGMGLNMDVDHVAFAALSKFDGHHMRGLQISEMAQIAGRAGRFMRDGTFGVTGDCPEIDSETVERLEAHEFDFIDHIYWRNSRLRFTSLDVLQGDLRKLPSNSRLIRPRVCEDEVTLEFLCKNPDIVSLAQSPRDVKLLWEVCQIPDFAKTMSDSHPRLLGQIFTHLRRNWLKLPTDWVNGHVQRLNRTDGDIDTLTQRLAAIRTWTYISQRANWLEDAQHWQGISRDIEDKISDALHEQLTKRFVDRRTSLLMKRLKDKGELLSAVRPNGEVLVEGHFVGQLEGFHFVADQTDNPHAKRAVNSAALKALRKEMDKRVCQFEEDDDEQFAFGEKGGVLWRGFECARLISGDDYYHPQIRTLSFDLLEDVHRQRVTKRLQQWLSKTIEKNIRVTHKKIMKRDWAGPARGLLYQLDENMGNVLRSNVEGLLKGLEREERRKLREFGIIIARHHVYSAHALKGKATRIRAHLWSIYHERFFDDMENIHGRMSFIKDEKHPSDFFYKTGYHLYGTQCVRLDIVEKIAEEAWTRLEAKKNKIDGVFASLAGCRKEDLGEILKNIGYSIENKENELSFTRKKHHMKMKKYKTEKKTLLQQEESPFALLKKLKS